MLASNEAISLVEPSLMTLHSQDVSSSVTHSLRMTENFQGWKHTNADVLSGRTSLPESSMRAKQPEGMSYHCCHHGYMEPCSSKGAAD
jgi:hypothetical protein